MGVDHYDCDGCGMNGIHEDNISHCHNGHHYCMPCGKNKKFIYGDEDDDYEIMNCPKCFKKAKDKQEQTLLNNMINLLLEMYNKRRKNKLTLEQLRIKCNMYYGDSNHNTPVSSDSD